MMFVGRQQSQRDAILDALKLISDTKCSNRFLNLWRITGAEMGRLSF